MTGVQTCALPIYFGVVVQGVGLAEQRGGEETQERVEEEFHGTNLGIFLGNGDESCGNGWKSLSGNYSCRCWLPVFPNIESPLAAVGRPRQQQVISNA